MPADNPWSAGEIQAALGSTPGMPDLITGTYGQGVFSTFETSLGNIQDLMQKMAQIPDANFNVDKLESAIANVNNMFGKINNVQYDINSQPTSTHGINAMLDISKFNVKPTIGQLSYLETQMEQDMLNSNRVINNIADISIAAKNSITNFGNAAMRSFDEVAASPDFDRFLAGESLNFKSNISDIMDAAHQVIDISALSAADKLTQLSSASFEGAQQISEFFPNFPTRFTTEESALPTAQVIEQWPPSQRFYMPFMEKMDQIQALLDESKSKYGPISADAAGIVGSLKTYPLTTEGFRTYPANNEGVITYPANNEGVITYPAITEWTPQIGELSPLAGFQIREVNELIDKNKTWIVAPLPEIPNQDPNGKYIVSFGGIGNVPGYKATFNNQESGEVAYDIFKNWFELNAPKNLEGTYVMSSTVALAGPDIRNEWYETLGNVAGVGGYHLMTAQDIENVKARIPTTIGQLPTVIAV